VIVVFAPRGADADDALARTRWIAERTLHALAEHGLATTAVLDEQATRTRLEQEITENVAGLAFFTHGRRAHVGQNPQDGRPIVIDDAIMGMDGPALDRDNLHLVTGRWGHAFACHAGTELAAQACAQGATCFVGYEGTLSVEWHPEALPVDVEPLVTALVTRTTCNLATGVRDKRRLCDDVSAIAEAIVAWCHENPERAAGLFLEVTAWQLVERLVYHGG
jgi:hypothetical protein